LLMISDYTDAIFQCPTYSSFNVDRHDKSHHMTLSSIK
jgi:hypothetical protein